MTTTAFTQLTSTINAASKPPTAVVAVFNGQVQSLNSATPGTPWVLSAKLPASFGAPNGICGDCNNGVAVFSDTQVAYLTGVGVAGAAWNVLPALPSGAGALKGLSGDPTNGLVIHDGINVYSYSFNPTSPSPYEWVLMSAPPTPVTGITGDPTNGILLAVGADTGPSSLYFTQGGCMCQWAPLTGGNLPVARVKIECLCGNIANGFVFYGENQLFSLAVKTATAPASPTGTLTKLPAVPFHIRALSGDGKNGISAIGGGGGDLIASSVDSSGNSWLVISVKEAPQS